MFCPEPDVWSQQVKIKFNKNTYKMIPKQAALPLGSAGDGSHGCKYFEFFFVFMNTSCSIMKKVYEFHSKLKKKFCNILEIDFCDCHNFIIESNV